MIFLYLCNLCNLWSKPSLFAFQLSNSGLTAKPIFRYWAWRLKTAATFSAGSGGAFSDVGKIPTLLEGGAGADPRHPGNRKGSRFCATPKTVMKL